MLTIVESGSSIHAVIHQGMLIYRSVVSHPSRLVGDEIHLERLGDRTSDKRQLEKYAFSNALALSGLCE